MASVSREPNGYRVVQFFGTDGTRRSIRLGKVSGRNAEKVKRHVESIVAAQSTGDRLSGEVLGWLRGLEVVMADKLAAVGLIPARPRTKLRPFLDEFIEKRENVKASTRLVYRRGRRYLVEHFGEDRLVQKITAGDAQEWQQWLRASGKDDNTVRRSCGLAKQFFRSAMRHGLIDTNPFEDLTSAVRGNASKFYFVSREEARSVLQACPDAEWRLMFALARYGGLRVPSELLLLRWADVNWETGRMLVRSPKTEHHPGKGERSVPIFPELRPYLLEGFESAADGAEWCIMRYRSCGVNLRTQLGKIIKRAGLTAWPKMWQNLRSTRQTELADAFPAHVVSAWLGNSVTVATKHYLQVTDSHFEVALQNPVQRLHATERNEAQPNSAESAQVEPPPAVGSGSQSFALACVGELKPEEWAILDSNQ